MAQGSLDAAIDRLHAVPLEEFVAERKRLAKELRAGGDRPGAAEVGKLPKPTAAAWALNHAAREEPDAVGEWLETAAALRDASTHAGQVGGDALRAAMAAHRAGTARLAAIVRERSQPGGRPLSEAMFDRVRTLLQAATADAELAERLRAGRLTEESPPAPVLPEPAPQSEPPPRRQPKGAPKRDRAAEARAERHAQLERDVRAAEEEAERLRDEADARAAGAAAADERLEEARRTLHRSESEAGAARAALEEAEQAAAGAERELQRLRTLLRRAQRSP